MSGRVTCFALILASLALVEAVTYYKIVRGKDVKFVKSTVSFQTATRYRVNNILTGRPVAWSDFFDKYLSNVRRINPTTYKNILAWRTLAKFRANIPSIPSQAVATVANNPLVRASTSAIQNVVGRAVTNQVYTTLRYGVMRALALVNLPLKSALAIPYVGVVINIVMTVISVVLILIESLSVNERQKRIDAVQANYGAGFNNYPLQQFFIRDAEHYCDRDYVSILVEGLYYSLRSDFSQCEPKGDVYFCIRSPKEPCAVDYSYPIKRVPGYTVLRDVCLVYTLTDEYVLPCLFYVASGGLSRLVQHDMICDSFYNITDAFIGPDDTDAPFILEESAHYIASGISHLFHVVNTSVCPFLNGNFIAYNNYYDFSKFVAVPAESGGLSRNMFAVDYDYDALVASALDRNNTVGLVTNSQSSNFELCSQFFDSFDQLVCDDASDGLFDRDGCEETVCRHYGSDSYLYSRRCYVCVRGSGSPYAPLLPKLKPVYGNPEVVHYASPDTLVVSGAVLTDPRFNVVSTVIYGNFSYDSSLLQLGTNVFHRVGDYGGWPVFSRINIVHGFNRRFRREATDSSSVILFGECSGVIVPNYTRTVCVGDKGVYVTDKISYGSTLPLLFFLLLVWLSWFQA